MRPARSRLFSTVAAVAVSGSLIALAPAAHAVEATDDVPTFAEFEASTVKDDLGRYLVDGDIPAGNKADLRKFYDRLTASPDPDSLIVNQVYGKDDVWSASQALNLTFCVSDKFGTAKTSVVNAMNSGAALWEGATSGVNFTYVASQDSNCTTRNTNVVFSVEPTKTTQYIARAFFPSTSKSSRNVLVNAQSLVSSGNWTPSNILGHELGHVLGFRHEHTRPEAGTCFEDNSWRPLTPYDSSSIMHYPQCNGSSDDLSMTDTDRAGARSVY